MTFARRPPREAPPDVDERGPEADHEAVGRKILLDQLTGQARSRSELAGKLAAKHVPEDVASGLLDRFEEVGLIDDSAFAREWAQSRHVSRGLARRALAMELRRKGVDGETVEAALSEVSCDSERETAGRLVRRRLRSLGNVDDAVRVRRLVGMLARKGYSPGVAYEVVRDELAAAGAETALLGDGTLDDLEVTDG
jgi:regulatory protein